MAPLRCGATSKSSPMTRNNPTTGNNIRSAQTSATACRGRAERRPGFTLCPDCDIPENSARASPGNHARINGVHGHLAATTIDINPMDAIKSQANPIRAKEPMASRRHSRADLLRAGKCGPHGSGGGRRYPTQRQNPAAHNVHMRQTAAVDRPKGSRKQVFARLYKEFHPSR